MSYESMSNDELLKLVDELEEEAGNLDAKQMAFKILLNSAYGALGNQHFRHYALGEATGITISGQVANKWSAKSVNQYINKVLKTDDIDYVVYGDTDSIYVDVSEFVKRFGNGKSEQEIVDMISKIAKEKLDKAIEDGYDELCKLTNAKSNYLEMKREGIGPIFFVAKKRYSMRVYDSEYVRYETPKIKIMGLEAVRTTTPEFCRKSMKQLIEYIFCKDEQFVVDYIEQTKEKFFSLPLEKIAMPTGVNGLLKYHCEDGFVSGTPSHVKAAITFNRMLKKHKLELKYQAIKEGDKIKVLMLKMPNPAQAEAIGFSGDFPTEFGLDKYLDKEAQFNKLFLEPIKRILDSIGWKHENSVDLEDFFS